MAERIASVERDGLTFDDYDEGPLEGDVVVLLHGFPERSSAWREIAPALHARGYRTVAMDQRGYSPGARPTRRRDYKLSLLIDDVAALVERTDGPVHVVGHDWGAVVAWGLATLRPELVRTLTAISVPHPLAFLDAVLRSAQGLRSWYILAFQLPRLPEVAASMRGGVFEQGLRRSGMTTEEIARFRTEMVDYGAMPGALGWYRAVPLLDRGLLNGSVSVPTTFIWSDGDIAVDRRSAERTEKYVDAPYEFVILAGVSHWAPTQAADECTEAILRRISS